MTTETAPCVDREAIIAIDLGKTLCRLEVVGGVTQFLLQGPGARLGYGPEGIDAVQSTITPLLTRAVATVGSSIPMVVGVAGSLHNPQARSRLAKWLTGYTQGPVAVTSDIVLAHAGAFAGGTGVCLVAGTGAIAMGVSPTGVWRLADGWGPDIGDLGGGTWIGREGLRAAINAREREGPDTVLAFDSSHAREIAEAATRDPVDAARIIASFAPAVINAACVHDAVAERIVSDAVRNLAQTAHAAVIDDHRVAIIGGLANHAAFQKQLTYCLSEKGLFPVKPDGDPSYGAFLIHTNHQLALERCIERGQR